VIHCFSGDYDFAMALIELGFYISFPGTVTYKNAVDTQAVAIRIPLERLLVETDCPYLAPVPSEENETNLSMSNTRRKRSLS